MGTLEQRVADALTDHPEGGAAQQAPSGITIVASDKVRISVTIQRLTRKRRRKKKG